MAGAEGGCCLPQNQKLPASKSSIVFCVFFPLKEIVFVSTESFIDL